MQITKSKFKQIIKEEYSRLLNEIPLGAIERAIQLASPGPRPQSFLDWWTDVWTSPKGAKTGTISAKQRAAGEKQPSGPPGQFPYGAGGWEKVARPTGPSTSDWKTGGGTTAMPPMVKGGPWSTMPKKPGFYSEPEATPEKELFDALLDAASYLVPGTGAIKTARATNLARRMMPWARARKALERTRGWPGGKPPGARPDFGTKVAGYDVPDFRPGAPGGPGDWISRQLDPLSGKDWGHLGRWQSSKRQLPPEIRPTIEDIFDLHGPVKPEPKWRADLYRQRMARKPKGPTEPVRPTLEDLWDLGSPAKPKPKP